jgi:hypothetical protein
METSSTPWPITSTSVPLDPRDSGLTARSNPSSPGQDTIPSLEGDTRRDPDDEVDSVECEQQKHFQPYPSADLS